MLWGLYQREIKDARNFSDFYRLLHFLEKGKEKTPCPFLFLSLFLYNAREKSEFVNAVYPLSETLPIVIRETGVSLVMA